MNMKLAGTLGSVIGLLGLFAVAACGGDDDEGGSGGAAGSTGGSNTGGSNTGGSNTGGSNTGGSNTGGSNTGGSNTGGSSGVGGQAGSAGACDFSNNSYAAPTYAVQVSNAEMNCQVTFIAAELDSTDAVVGVVDAGTVLNVVEGFMNEWGTASVYIPCDGCIFLGRVSV